MPGWLLSYPVFFAQHLKTQNQNQNYADKNPISPCHPQGLHLSDPGLEGNNAEDTITDWFSFTLVPSSGSEPLGGKCTWDSFKGMVSS